jgi:hypothetical protein
MAKLEYDPTAIAAYARRLYRRATLASIFGVLIGAAGGAMLGGAAAFAYEFATSLRVTMHSFVPGINVEEATRLATKLAQQAAAGVGLLGAVLGFYRGGTAGLTYRLTAQTALGQVELQRQLAGSRER